MRDKLKAYVSLLFEGVPNAAEMQQEILQNTLDRYDDLVSQGRSPETAYRIAVSGIGDINELITEDAYQVPTEVCVTTSNAKPKDDSVMKQIFRALAIFLYIICPIPLVVFDNIGTVFGLEESISSVIGLCATLLLVAIATVLIILGKKKHHSNNENTVTVNARPAESPLRRKIRTIVFIPCIVLYLTISFISGAWYITWLFFPLAGSVTGLIFAIMDLKEAVNNEK